MGFDETNCNKMISALHLSFEDKPEVTTIGIVGALTIILQTCQLYLKLSSDESAHLEIVFSSDERESNVESLFALVKNQKIAFVYYDANAAPFESAPLASSLLAIDYVRYLTDLCEDIIVVLPNTVNIDLELDNPFQDAPNTGMIIKEVHVEQSKNIEVTALQMTPLPAIPCLKTGHECSELCQANTLTLTNDHTARLFAYHAELQEKVNTSERKINVNLLKNHQKIFPDEFKSMTYTDVKKFVQEEWYKASFFEHMTDRAPKIFHGFLRPEHHSDFAAVICRIFDDAVRATTSIHIEEALKTLDSFIKTKLRPIAADYKCNKGNDGMFRKVTGYFVRRKDPEKGGGDCTPESCPIVGTLLRKWSEETGQSILNQLQIKANSQECKEGFEFVIHKTKIDDFRKEFLDEAWKYHIRDAEKRCQNELDDVRRLAIADMFAWLKERVVAEQKMYTLHLDIMIFTGACITDKMEVANDFKITNTGRSILLKLECEEGKVDKLHVSQLFFITNSIGYINISNWPEGYGRVYVFNLEMPYALPELVTMLRSADARIIVDPKAKTYFIYDNEMKRIERARLNETTYTPETTVTTEDLYNTDIIDLPLKATLEYIHSICFGSESESMLLLDGNYNLVEYKPLVKDDLLKAVFKRKNEGTHIANIPITDSSAAPYLYIDSLPDGQCVLLQSSKSLDIYDLNWLNVGQIPIKNENAKFKIFSSDANAYVQVHDSDGFRVYRLSGLTPTTRFEVKDAKVERSAGFPYLDIFYLVQRKFGPQTSCIGAPRKTNLHFFISQEHINRLDDIDAYFGTLKTTRIDLKLESIGEIDIVTKFRQRPIAFDIIKRIIETRVPLHVATIEQCNLFPLRNGLNITNDIAAWRCVDESTVTGGFLAHLVELIQLGSYEAMLKNLVQPLKIVSIVGRQSGGKSYLLNRLTGTRFNVASTRCTDGIWLSMAYISDQPFVILDCEGLFSTRRNEIEETKLCLCLAAMTDVFILNQDLAFSRHLTTLFNNFAKACDRIKGSNLFKGFLEVVIRDVSTQDLDGAYRELIDNIKQQSVLNKSGYMRKLFGGETRSLGLHHFENSVFESEIETLRKILLDLPARWPNGNTFLETLKLILAQVHTDDDTLMDIHRLRLAFVRLEHDVKKAHIEGGKIFEKCKPCSVSIKILNDPSKEETIIFEQSSLDFSEYIKDSSTAGAAFLFRDNISQQIAQDYNACNHDTFFTNVNHALQTTLTHRVDFLMSYVHNQLPTSDLTFSAEINNFELNLKAKLNALQECARLCLRRCRECIHLCSKEHDHRDDCDCGTDHLCQEECSYCATDPNKSSISCSLKFGHEERHRCNKGHACGASCTILETCTSFCGLPVNHDADKSRGHVHDCGALHYCPSKCQSCQSRSIHYGEETHVKNCASDVKKEHERHDCGEKLCLHPCSMPDCQKLCKFPDHFHDLHIKNKNRSILKRDKLILDYHICDDDHPCGNNCDQKGVCDIEMKLEQREWVNSLNKFDYTYYRPKNSRQPCVIRLPPYHRSHPSNVHHDCGRKEKHRCGAQCPECLSFCSSDVNHQGPHDTHTHRNKECNVWALKAGDVKPENRITVQNPGETARLYNAGESCRPETCSIACKRRGRAHAHLKECPGPSICPAKMYSYVRHSNDTWQPYPDKKFDLWLCKNYWHSLNWKQPLNVDAERETIQLISKCSFVCAHPNGHPGEVEERFCTKEAWHNDEHKFTCEHPTVSNLDIVFVCDTTGSMSGYMNEVKTRTCQRIMETALSVVKDVQFHFVAYRDHPPQDSTYVTKQSNGEGEFCNAAQLQAFVSTLDAGGGGDGPEAVLDGLWVAAVKSKWRLANTLKYIVHIADAPPHGRLYTNGSGDGFPEGCPCGYTIEQIANVLNTKQIRYKLMKIGSSVNTMATIFKKHIKEYEESDLNGALDLTNKFVGILARDLQVKEMDVRETK